MEITPEESGAAVNVMPVVAGVAAVAPARGSPARSGGSRFTRRGILLLTCAGTVAAATVLATLLVLAEFPRNTAGKTLKRELRAPFWEGRAKAI